MIKESPINLRDTYRSLQYIYIYIYNDFLTDDTYSITTMYAIRFVVYM